jgi:branched-chain amino acid transport system permease protein
LFNFGILINLLAMIVLGGWGTFWGPIIGTALLTILPEALRAVKTYRNLSLGLSLALIVVLAPQGLGPLLIKWSKNMLQFFQKRLNVIDN